MRWPQADLWHMRCPRLPVPVSRGALWELIWFDLICTRTPVFGTRCGWDGSHGTVWDIWGTPAPEIDADRDVVYRRRTSEPLQGMHNDPTRAGPGLASLPSPIIPIIPIM